MEWAFSRVLGLVFFALTLWGLALKADSKLSLPAETIVVPASSVYISPMIAASSVGLSSQALGRSVGLGVVGLVGGIVEDNDWVFETGLLYLRAGGLLETTTLKGMNYQTQTSLDYVSLPLIAKKKIYSKAKSSFFLQGGVWPSFLVRASEETGAAGYQQVSSVYEDMAKFDFIGALGAGYKLGLAKDIQAGLDLYWLRGLATVSDLDSQLRNQGLLLAGSISFGVGRLSGN